MRGVLAELYRRDRLLTVAGWSQLAVLGVIPSLTQGRQLAAVWTFAVVYLALGTLAFMQATRGMPLVPS